MLCPIFIFKTDSTIFKEFWTRICKSIGCIEFDFLDVGFN